MTSIGFSRKFDKDVSSVISEFLIDKHYKIKDCYSIKNLQKNGKININRFVQHLTNNPNPHVNIYIEELINKIVNNKIKIGNYGWRCLACSAYFSPSLENYFISNFENLDIIVKENLTYNSSAINVIKTHLDKIDINSLCSNQHPDIVNILEQNLDKINMKYLKYNKKALSNTIICNYIISNYKNINEILACSNDNIVNEILQKILINNNLIDDFNKDNWENLCYNTHPSIIQLIEKNIHIINSLENRSECWNTLCCNNSAINIIEKNINMILSLDDIDRNECLCIIITNPLMTHIVDKNTDIINLLHDDSWEYFCANSSNIQFIEKNIDKVDFEYLVFNKHASELIEKNLDKISVGIYENPNIFELDSKKYKNDMNLMINKIYNL